MENWWTMAWKSLKGCQYVSSIFLIFSLTIMTKEFTFCFNINSHKRLARLHELAWKPCQRMLKAIKQPYVNQIQITLKNQSYTKNNALQLHIQAYININIEQLQERSFCIDFSQTSAFSPIELFNIIKAMTTYFSACSTSEYLNCKPFCRLLLTIGEYFFKFYKCLQKFQHFENFQ